MDWILENILKIIINWLKIIFQLGREHFLFFKRHTEVKKNTIKSSQHKKLYLSLFINHISI